MLSMTQSLYTLLFLFLNLSLSYQDTITSIKPLQDSQTIVSKDATFKLGFFSPDPKSTNRYLGIWFNKVPVFTVVWIANRNNPVTDSSGVLKVSDNGNLVLFDGLNRTIWSSNSSNVSNLNRRDVNASARLMDSGNLVVVRKGEIVWESFENPTNTLLPGMKPTVSNTQNKENFLFRSWKTTLDPSDGVFEVGIGTIGIPQVFIWKNGVNFWRSGPWDGNNFIGIGNVDATINDGFILEDNAESGTLDISFDPQDVSAMLNYMIDPQGTIKEQYWNESSKSWLVGWSAPNTQCDFYGKCGAFGNCNQNRPTICECFKGFEPKNGDEWKKGNWSSGCSRRKRLQCGNSSNNTKQDGFLRIPNLKLPDNVEQVQTFNQDSCRIKCLSNCSCLAYAYHMNIGCMLWSKDLIDIQEYSIGGVDLFLRLEASELEGQTHKKTAIIASVTIAGIIVAAILIYFLWRRITQPGKIVEKLDENKYRENTVVHDELQKPPLYTFETLRTATDNFQDSNKLGEGGFGPVYKGTLEDGQVIAVKRLSRASEQGLEEFMNEVAVISKLQHRNLVRLLGCCIEGDEKMLVYEYMPNKSLDAALFDPQNQKLLPWEKRRNIIDGLRRGLLYLHRDSRLKIIHRDLKTSNILLDRDLNPKISDFGMARIFGGNEDQANTRRVVGTYGYMSPEYMMGQFSEKSDVYSFGVILLEIISGRRNSSFNSREHTFTLLGHAWNLWTEGKIVSLIDPAISEPSFQAEILKSIQVALLCAQELPNDRPNISTVISMLENDIKHLQHPKKPPFTEWDISSDDQQSKSASAAYYSVSIVEAR